MNSIKTYLSIGNEYMSYQALVSLDLIAELINTYYDIFNNRPEIATIIADIECEFTDEKSEEDCGCLYNPEVIDSDCCTIAITPPDYFQVEYSEKGLKSRVYSLREAVEAVQKSAADIIKHLVNREIEDGAEAKHALQSVIYDILQDEDCSAWHDGKLTYLVSAIIDVVKEYGFGAIQIYGYKEPKQGQSALQVIVV
ncbi:MAG: hypothetical protein QXS54_06715 [Candidatus Methanomethylicaceae archaeon]